MTDFSRNCSTARNSSEFTFVEPEHSHTTIILLIAMAIVVFIENVTVCVLFFMNKKLRITTNIFVVSLAVSDLLVALLFVPVYLGTAVGNKVNLYVVTFLLFSSLFNLCGVTYDRYQAILQPLTYHAVLTSLRIATILFFIWILPVILILLPLIWSSQDLKTGALINRIYLGFMVAVVFTSCVAISKVYYRIFKAIRRQLKRKRHVKGMFGQSELSSTFSVDRSTTQFTLPAESPSLVSRMSDHEIQPLDVLLPKQNTTSSGLRDKSSTFQQTRKESTEKNAALETERNSQTPRVEKRNGSKKYYDFHRKLRIIRFKNYSERILTDVRAVKLFAIIILVFVICWLPVIIINFMVAIDKVAFIPQFIFDISVYAFVANAIVNPLLFTFYKRDYRRALLQLISCRWIRSRRRKSVRSFHTVGSI